MAEGETSGMIGLLDGQEAPATIATTRGDRRTRLFAGGLALGLLAVSLLVLPVGSLPGPQVPAFLPIFSSCVVIGDLLTAYLLYHQARLVGLASLTVLAAGYLFTGSIALLQLLVFPGVFSATGLLGAGTQSAVWLWMVWHGGFAAYVLLYALLAGRERRQGFTMGRGYRWSLPATLLLFAGLALLVTVGQHWLPVLVVAGNYRRSFEIGTAPAVLALGATALILLLFRTRLGTLVQIWLGVAILASFLDSAVTLYAGIRFSFGWYVARIDSVMASALILLALQGETIRLYGEVVALNRRLGEMVAIDGLTGIANRRHFDGMLAGESRRCARLRLPLSLLLLDVDYFKRYNDALGHPAGDACLKAVAAAVAGSINRPGDLAARYGGEEFVVLAPGTDAVGAAELAKRIRLALQGLAMPHPEGIGPFVTVSIGMATAMPARTGGEAALLAAADAALYRAKAAGRDCAEAAPAEPAEARYPKVVPRPA